MKHFSLALLSVLGLIACSEAPPERMEKSSLKNYNSTADSADAGADKPVEKVEAAVPIPVVPAIANQSNPASVVPPQAPAAPLPPAPVVSPAPSSPMESKPVSEADMLKFLALAEFTVSGLPKDATDLAAFEMKIKADPLITHFSYKVGTAASCKIATGYKVETIGTAVKIDVSKLADGDVSVCLLRYLAPGKLWQKTENGSLITWKKIPFVRTIKSQFSEYDYDCKKEIITKAEIRFNGAKSTYKWTRDAKSQGCQQATTTAEDAITIVSSDETQIIGYWTYLGEDSNGWYKFKWKNKERTAFSGGYGYGDPALEAEGPWNSIP